MISKRLHTASQGGGAESESESDSTSVQTASLSSEKSARLRKHTCSVHSCAGPRTKWLAAIPCKRKPVGVERECRLTMENSQLLFPANTQGYVISEEGCRAPTRRRANYVIWERYHYRHCGGCSGADNSLDDERLLGASEADRFMSIALDNGLFRDDFFFFLLCHSIRSCKQHDITFREEGGGQSIETTTTGLQLVDGRSWFAADMSWRAGRRSSLACQRHVASVGVRLRQRQKRRRNTMPCRGGCRYGRLVCRVDACRFLQGGLALIGDGVGPHEQHHNAQSPQTPTGVPLAAR